MSEPPPPTAATPLEYHGTGGDRGRYVDNDRLAWWASGLLWLYAGLSLVQQVLSVAQTAASQQLTAVGGGGGGSIVMPLVMLVGLACISLVLFAAFVAAVVVYMIWQYRAATNGAALGSPTRIGPGWGVGWWFIPVANILMPLLVLRDLWRNAVPGESPTMTLPTSAAVCFLVSLVVAIAGGTVQQVRLWQAGGYAPGAAVDVFEVMFTWDYFVVITVAALLWSAGLVLLGLFVRRVTARQAAAFAEAAG